MILFDTDMLTLLMNGHAKVVQRTNTAEADAGITIVSRIEVLQGRFASVVKAADGESLLRAQERLLENERFMDDMVVATFDTNAAAEFDRLRLEKKLKKIGLADLLIASIALANRAMLVTRNLKHFRLVPGLKVENWAD